MPQCGDEMEKMILSSAVSLSVAPRLEAGMDTEEPAQRVRPVLLTRRGTASFTWTRR